MNKTVTDTEISEKTENASDSARRMKFTKAAM